MPDSPNPNDPRTSEVLSQIADEEIDRLLAQNQDSIPTKTEDLAPTPSTASISNVIAEEANLELNKQLDDLFNALNEAAVDVPQPSEDLLRQFTADPPPAPEPPPSNLSPAEPPPAEITAQVPLAETLAPEPELTLPSADPLPQPEAQKLPDPQPETPLTLSQQVIAAALNAEATSQPAEATPAPRKRKIRTPSIKLKLHFPRVLLKPLYFFSESFSEKTLDWMGKIAILTTANALLLLAYIVIFRKPQ